MDVIKVGMADMNVTVSPGILTTLGLGSCVAICLYDAKKKVAGLAHIMLPSSKLTKNDNNVAKFADTAIHELLKRIVCLGAHRANIVAKLAGGAQMFSFKDNTSEILRIGERNIESTLQILSQLGIPVLAQDIGGNYGRTVELYAENGSMLVRTIGNGTKII